MYPPLGSIIDVKTNNFEKNDRIDNNYFKKFKNLKWSIKLLPGDKDEIIVDFKYPPDNQILFQV